MHISQLEAIIFTGFFGTGQMVQGGICSTQQSSTQYSLASRVENLKHGIKDGGYIADARLVVSNQGAQSLAKSSWMYSLCFGNLEKNERGWCVGGGKGGDINILNPGQEVSKDVTVKYKGEEEKSLRGMTPHFTITVTATDSSEELYKHNHDLTPIGDYPK